MGQITDANIEAFTLTIGGGDLVESSTISKDPVFPSVLTFPNSIFSATSTALSVDPSLFGAVYETVWFTGGADHDPLAEAMHESDRKANIARGERHRDSRPNPRSRTRHAAAPRHGPGHRRRAAGG